MSSASAGAGSGAQACFFAPASCGFPDGSDTGVPAGTVLKPRGSFTISTRGAVVSGLDVTGTVTIAASDVTLMDSRIMPSAGATGIAVRYSGVSGVVIEHVEIDGADHSPSAVGITGSGFIVEAANIHGTADAIDVGSNDVVRDSWIHDLFVVPGDHTDGVQSSGGANVVISHNTINAEGSHVNSAVILGADLGPLINSVVIGNLLAGGGFTVYAGTNGTYSSGVITIADNRFVKDDNYGPCSFKPSPGATISATGNVWDAGIPGAVC
jgi:hypothetical protein